MKKKLGSFKIVFILNTVSLVLLLLSSYVIKQIYWEYTLFKNIDMSLWIEPYSFYKYWLSIVHILQPPLAIVIICISVGISVLFILRNNSSILTCAKLLVFAIVLTATVYISVFALSHRDADKSNAITAFRRTIVKDISDVETIIEHNITNENIVPVLLVLPFHTHGKCLLSHVTDKYVHSQDVPYGVSLALEFLKSANHAWTFHGPNVSQKYNILTNIDLEAEYMAYYYSYKIYVRQKQVEVNSGAIHGWKFRGQFGGDTYS